MKIKRIWTIGINLNFNGKELGSTNKWELKMIYKNMYGHK